MKKPKVNMNLSDFKFFVLLFSTLMLFGFLFQYGHSQLNVDLDEMNDKSISQQTENNINIELMALKAQLKPDSSPYLADNGYYQVKKFGFVVNNGSEICPSNNCKFTVENTRFYPNTSTGGYVFDGRLKVTTIDDNIKKSKFYDFYVLLNKDSEEEIDGKITEFLGGKFGFGKNKFNPEFRYEITNATLTTGKNPILSIQGEKTQ